ncbi:hypothetical protein ACF3OF_03045 [Sneathia vaginalis]|uniref:hypothetical protein n=1 Tax=Sneathia vaginalis TaxID=187101 RepID=UPI00370D1A4D
MKSNPEFEGITLKTITEDKNYKETESNVINLTPTADGLSLDNNKITSLKNGEKDNDAVAYGQVKNPFIVKADKSTSKDTEKSMSLGKTLEFTGRKFDGTKNYDDWSVDASVTGKSGNYTSENVETFVTQDNKTGRTGVLIGLRKDPRFDKVTLGTLDGNKTEINSDGISITKKATPDKVAKFGIDDKGNATLTDARNKDASPIVTEKSLGDQKIKYATNNGTKQETTLTNGFNFSDGTNTEAKVEKDGVVKFNLKNDLTGITSIENKGTKVTLTEKGTEFKTGTDGVTTKIDKEGIKITKQDEQNPSVSIKAGDTTNGPSIDFATKEEGQDNNKKTVGTGSITGLKDRKASDKTNDYGTGENIGKATTEGAVKEVYDQINSNTGIKKSVGDGKDGRDGKDGTGSAGSKGLTEKDKLNGKDLTTKVNALRNGEAGTVVYTDSEGNRLVKANDGNYYRPEEIKDDGTVKTEAENNNKKPTGYDNPELRLVDAKGETTKPITLGNLENALGLKGTDVDNDIIKKLVGNNKTDKFNDKELNRAVTLKDLQYVAKQGLEFSGNSGTVRKAIGDKITIAGESTLKEENNDNGKADFDKRFNASNVATMVEKDGTIRIGIAKDLTANSISSEEDKTDKTKTKITLSKDGATLHIEKNGKPEGNTTKIDKEGIKITKQGEQNPSVSIKAGDTTNGPSIDFATTSADNKTVGTGSITGLKDRKASDKTNDYGTGENIGRATTEGAVKEVYDQINSNTGIKKSVGDGKDGRDGKDGTGSAGLTGLTEKDGLNGKDLTTKVNALRNGEAGTVVYTDSEGNRLVKDNKGDYYKAGDVDDSGKAKDDRKKVTEIKATLVNPNGTTDKPTTVLRVADGSIATDSKEAINGGQLKTLGYMLGLDVNDKKNGFKLPKIKDLIGENTTPLNILEGLNQTREHINKGLTFEANYDADNTGKLSINKILGETLSITASGATDGKYNGYTGKNLATYVKQGKFYIGMKETPTFKSINIGSTGFGEHQTDKGKGDITADNEGLKLTYDKASVTIAKDGDKAKLSGLKDANIDENTYGTAGVAATQKEVKDVLNKINTNGTEQSKLKNGTLGTVVYTDKDGKRLAKANDGKYYKAEYVEDNGALKVGHSYADEVKVEDILATLVKPDGKTTEPITLGNVASALGLSKDKKDKNNEILNKLVNKEAKDVYKEAELNKAVTLRDLQFLASKGITFVGSTGTANKYLGDTITINGSNSKDLTKDNFATKYETKNIAVKVDNNTGNIEVGLAKELKNINSIENDKTKLSLAEKGIEITKQGEQNPFVSIKAGDTTNGPSIDFETKEEGQGTDKKTVGTGSITGLKDRKASDTTNNYGIGANIGRATTEGAVKEVYDKLSTVEGNINTLNGKGLIFAGNSGKTKENKLGETVNIKGAGTVANNFKSACR